MSSDGNGTATSTAIRIFDVKPGIFKILLDFIYLSATPEIEDEADARDLLIAVDRFRCVPLKLYAESVLADRFLTVSNAAAMLLLADSRSCAMLKEASTGLFLAYPRAVMAAREDWARVRESRRLLDELLVAFSHTSERWNDGDDDEPKNDGDEDRTDDGDDDHDDDYGAAVEAMDVIGLRRALEDAGLELDGSRDMLVRRLRSQSSDSSGGWETLQETTE